MHSLIAALMAAAISGAALAAGNVQEVQSAGSEGPKAKAEQKHLAKKHGLKSAKQPEVQAAGSEKAQSKAEEIHTRKSHGKLNNPAEEQMKKDAPRL